MAKSLHTEAWGTFLETLVEARNEARLTQIELGNRIGRTQSFVSKVERGERRLDVLEYCEWIFALEGSPSACLKSIEATLARK